MAGQYITKLYLRDDYQDVYRIKIQPETQTLILDGRSNDDAGNDQDYRQFVKVSGSRRGRGNHARIVRFRFTGTVPTGYTIGGELSLPWLRPEGFDGFTTNSVGTYQGFPVVFTRKRPEHFS